MADSKMLWIIGGAALVWYLMQQQAGAAGVGPPPAGGGKETPVPVPAGSRTLRMGARGDDVVQLQIKLAVAGYSVASDGVFGKLTLEAVKAFQRSRNLKADGIVGPQTWDALSALSFNMPHPPTRI